MKKTDNEIEKTLASLDNIERAKVSKEFTSELLQKVRFLKGAYDPWHNRLKYGIAAMITLALINGYVLFNTDWLSNSEETQIEALANEWYNESDLIEYDYESE